MVKRVIGIVEAVRVPKRDGGSCINGVTVRGHLGGERKSFTAPKTYLNSFPMIMVGFRMGLVKTRSKIGRLEVDPRFPFDSMSKLWDLHNLFF